MTRFTTGTYLDELLLRAVATARGNLQSRVHVLDNAAHHGPLRTKPISLMVWHCTAGDTLSAAWSWLDRVLHAGESPGSYHYGIDKDGRIDRKLPVSVVGYHAGASSWPLVNGVVPPHSSVNARAVGASFANDNGSDANFADDELTLPQLESGLWLARVMTQQFPGITGPADHVAHREVAPLRKTDPLPRILPMDAWRQAIQLTLLP